MATSSLMFCMTCSDGLDLPLGAGAAGFEFAAGNMYTGSGVCGNWLKDMLLGIFHYFFPTTLLTYQGTNLFLFFPRPKSIT